MLGVELYDVMTWASIAGVILVVLVMLSAVMRVMRKLPARPARKYSPVIKPGASDELIASMQEDERFRAATPLRDRI